MTSPAGQPRPPASEGATGASCSGGKYSRYAPCKHVACSQDQSANYCTSAPAPVADAKDAPYMSETSPKHVLFAPGTAPETVRSRTAAKATTTGPPHKTGTAASSRKKPRPRQRHMVYAIKLTEEGMKSFQEEHFGPPPAGLTEEQRRTWWRKRKCSLSVIIPRHCIHRFNLHAANPSLVSFIREGNILESAVAFADNSSRRTSALPSPQLVAEVAKYMHQEGDKAQWYRFAKTGD